MVWTAEIAHGCFEHIVCYANRRTKNVIIHQAWIVYPHFGMQQINKQFPWGQWGKQKKTNLSFCLSLKSGLSVSINLHAGFHLNPLKKIFVLQTSWLFTHKFCCIKKDKTSKVLNQQKQPSTFSLDGLMCIFGTSCLGWVTGAVAESS